MRTHTHTDRSDQADTCRNRNGAGNSNGHIYRDKHRLYTVTHTHVYTPTVVWHGALIADLVWEGPVTTHSHQTANTLAQHGRHTQTCTQTHNHKH